MNFTKAQKQLFALLGKKGGQSKTKDKTEASRKNGKLGGRPKGSKNKETQ